MNSTYLKASGPELFLAVPSCSLLVLWLAACTGSSAIGDDWYRFRGPDLNGISNETNWNTDLRRVPAANWKTNVGTGLSGLVVSDGCVYTMGNDNNNDVVYCLDFETGEVQWQHEYSCPVDANEFEGGPTATPTVDQDRLYTLSRQGLVICFDKKKGTVLWKENVAYRADVRAPGWGFAGSPFVADDLLLLNVGDAGLAVKKTTGDLVWSSEDKDSGYSSMVPYTHHGIDGVVFGSARSYVWIDIKSGQELWRQRWLTTFGCNAADPLVVGPNVFISSGYNRGSALLRATENSVAVLWNNKNLQTQLSSSVHLNGFIYGIHGDVDSGTELRCLNLKSGAVAWTAPEIHPSSLSATPNHLILTTAEGELIIARATHRRFEVVSRRNVLTEKCWTAPVLSNGHILCRDHFGEVVCIDVRPTAAQ